MKPGFRVDAGGEIDERHQIEGAQIEFLFAQPHGQWLVDAPMQGYGAVIVEGERKKQHIELELEPALGSACGLKASCVR